MPINTDLSVSPYFDDYSENKNFYRVLFKPGTAVQVREINQLQQILQAQIEKFGNNIYKRGTIIDGVNFIYHTNYNYVKINDSQLDGVPAAPAIYVGNFAVDPVTNLTAHIINSQDGYESTDPNLKTLYVRYINSGDSGTETGFSAGAVVKVYDYLDSMNKIVVSNGSSGFANNDSVVFCSAISVAVSSSTPFTVGETVTQAGNTHFAIIDGITTARGNTVLKLRPRQTDLSNTAVSSTVWQFDAGQSIVGSVSNATATISEVIGKGAKGLLTTTADIGKITKVEVTARGSGYYVAPYIAVKSSGVSGSIGARNYTDLSLSGRNYIAQLTVSTKADPVGNAYAFGVTEGVIYQKGYFLHVKPQTIIVDKYSGSPDQVAIGFDSVETIVDSNSDQSLLDNASGQPNEFAPGADRLNIEPKLVVVSSDEAAANNEFFSIVEFSEGYPYRESKRTQFNSLMDEMATRTNEQSGNFVLDRFEVTTRSTRLQANEGKQFAVITDPGKAYIDGYRVETNSNYVKNVDKGIDVRAASNLSASINYGNYVNVNNFNGVFNLNTGTVVKLYDTARAFSTDATTFGNVANPAGTQIGTARIRNVNYDTGEQGTSSAVYRLYLFDIRMNNSRSFAETRSIFFDSVNDGVADVVLTYDATSNSNIAVLNEVTSGTSLLIDTGSDSTNNLNNLNYIYRYCNEALEVNPAGAISILLTAPEESFGYVSNSLADNDKKELIVVPVSNNVVMQVNSASNGTMNVDNNTTTITPTIPASMAKFGVGDYIALYSSASNYTIRRIVGKSATSMTIGTTPGFTLSNANFSKVFPKGVPFALARLTGASATISNKTMNISLGGAIESTVNISVAATYDVKVSNASPTARVANRKRYVKINVGASEGQLNGPWCLGIPDVFRLRGVYLGIDSNVSVGSTNVTDQFYIDNNHTPDYVGLSYLMKRPDANITITSTTWLLVEFDAFTGTNGVRTVNSYVSANTAQRFADDSLTLDTLGTKVNTFEIPEVYSAVGDTYDLINCIDFRPVVANTVVYATTPAAAPVNPAQTVNFDNSNKKFPLPETAITFDRSYFLGRKDVVVVNTNNRVNIVRGVPADSQPYADPKLPSNVIVLKKLTIPSYPCIPEMFSTETLKILDKKMSNERILVKRIRDKTITSETTIRDIEVAQPRGYTMEDVGKLERRIADLEYTVALSLVESDLKDKVIPSAVNPSINRFKFGFFVDDYTTKKNSDVDNAEYQVDVIDSRVVPIAQSTLMTHGHGYRVSAWTSEIALITQDLASEPPKPVVVTPTPVVTVPVEETAPVVVQPAPTPETNNPITVVPVEQPVVVAPPPTPTPPPPVVVPEQPSPVTPVVEQPVEVITAQPVSVFRSYRASSQYRYDEHYVTMTSLPSTYNIVYNFYGDKDRLFVVKILNDGSESLVWSGNVKKRGTLNFNHDPSTGRQYVIRVIASSSKWEYTLNYSIDNVSYAMPAPPATDLNTLFYTGLLSGITPGYISAQNLEQDFGKLAYVTQGTTQTITVSGLKPNTLHNVSISDYTAAVDISGLVTTSGGSGAGVKTNEYGQATFSMNIDAQTLGSLSYILNGTSGDSSLSNAIICSMVSSDYSSSVYWQINTLVAPTNVVTPTNGYNVDVNGSFEAPSPYYYAGGGISGRFLQDTQLQ